MNSVDDDCGVTVRGDFGDVDIVDVDGGDGIGWWCLVVVLLPTSVLASVVLLLIL